MFDGWSDRHGNRIAGEVRFSHIKLEFEARAIARHQFAVFHAGGGGDSDPRFVPHSGVIKISGDAARTIAGNPRFATICIEDSRCEVRVPVARRGDEHDAVCPRAVVTLTHLARELSCGPEGGDVFHLYDQEVIAHSLGFCESDIAHWMSPCRAIENTALRIAIIA